MLKKEPLINEFYRHKEAVYKVTKLSRATDEIELEDIADGKLFKVAYSVFKYGYERVIKVGDAAKLLGRHPRSIYRYEKSGVIRKPMLYSHRGVRQVRFYTLEEVVELHEMISQLHQGRPRKDNKVVNNTMVDIGTLKLLIKEKYG